MKTSIIIPFCENYDQLITTVKSLKDNTELPFEVVLSLNSEYYNEVIITALLEKKLIDKVYYNSKQIGFTQAIIDGGRLIDPKADLVIMCNSDIEMNTCYWLEKIEKVFEEKKIQAAGIFSNSAGYQTISYDDYKLLQEMNYKKTIEVPYINGFFYIIRLKVFSLDNYNFPDYASEDDISLKLNNKVIITNIYAHHLQSQTYDIYKRNDRCNSAMKKLKEIHGENNINNKIMKIESIKEKLMTDILLEKIL